jgi:hypothetical protein
VRVFENRRPSFLILSPSTFQFFCIQSTSQLHDVRWPFSCTQEPALVCSEVRVVSMDGAANEAELLAYPSPDRMPLLLCPSLLHSTIVEISCGSGPPFRAHTKALLLQENVTVAPCVLSAPHGSGSQNLPQPFPARALFCKMRALVIGRRRVSKRLVFLDLAPLSAAADSDLLGHARRALWQHPGTQGNTRYFSECPCEQQPCLRYAAGSTSSCKKHGNLARCNDRATD